MLERITEWELENIESSCDFVSCDNSAGKGLNAQLSLWSTYSDATLNFTFTGVRPFYMLTVPTGIIPT